MEGVTFLPATTGNLRGNVSLLPTKVRVISDLVKGMGASVVSYK